jgi:uncharacterized membrane protein
MTGTLYEPGTNIKYLATALFAVAILHTFVSAKIGHLAHKFPKDSARERLLHLLGEVEVVFGLWATIFLFSMGALIGVDHTVAYVESLNFTEPAFVFVVMAMSATRPVLYAAEEIIRRLARIMPMSPAISFYWVTLTVGPLLGSFITEPAAMTVTAMILLKTFMAKDVSRKFRYLTMAALLVNVSIGGTLTHFAAPPVLMVASTWGWDLKFMLTHFGYKSISATVLIASYTTWLARDQLRVMAFDNKQRTKSDEKPHPPYWLVAAHIAFLSLAVFMAHHIAVFVGVFLLFMGLTIVTHYYQSQLQYDKSLLVALFLGGLVVLGRLQSWWIEPILQGLASAHLFIYATLLTAITDNAALTYLGAQVPNISEELKYALVAGAVTGGGLTVIANAPNPAGFAILKGTFRDGVINPGTLFLYAIIPTIIAAFCLWYLPSPH